MDSKILREYLIALGFKYDEHGGKKVDGALDRINKQTMALGKALVGTAGSVTAMVAVFVEQMEKLYYASKLADSSADNLKALDYGSRQVGLAAGVLVAATTSLARALRSNPGLQGLIESLGVPVTGRDKSDVMLDMVEQLRKMPPYIAQQYAALFGIDPDTLFLMEQGLDKLRQAEALRKQMSQEAGVDTDKAAEAAKDYANALREVWERVGLLKDALSIKLLPAFREVTGVANEALKDWTNIISKWTSWGDFAKNFMIGLTGRMPPGSGVKLTPEAQARVGSLSSTAGAGRGSVNPPQVGGSPSPSLFDALEAKYGLPAGVLDRMWNQESRRGKFMLSPKGAKGHFGFMDQTAQEWGVSDPNDLAQSATGAAKYLHFLMRKYGGDLDQALAAYNWGPGNLAKFGMGALPSETLGYVRDVGHPGAGGVTMQQKTDIHIHGVNDPVAAGNQVASKQEGVNADLVRNLQGAVQ